jgi:hypothetical protein
MGAGDLPDGEVHELILTGEVHVHELLHNEQKSPEGPRTSGHGMALGIKALCFGAIMGTGKSRETITV